MAGKKRESKKDEPNQEEPNKDELKTEQSKVEKEIVNKHTTKFIADTFYINVSETGENQLDKLNEEGDIIGKRRWVAKNMKLKDQKLLRPKEEGAMFQADLEMLVKVI